MKSIKIIIAGSRNFNDYKKMRKTLDSIISLKVHEGDSVEIIEGGARGADKLGMQYALEEDIPFKEFPAEWENLNVTPCVVKIDRLGRKYNVLAGHNRNKKMAEYAKKESDIAILVAFWDGKSPGTKNMIEQAQKLKIEVVIVKEEDNSSVCIG